MPDRIEFTFSLMWEQPGLAGQLVDYAESHHYLDLARAKEEHLQAGKGSWVTHRMVRPHLSALRVVKNGRILAEEMRPAKDLPEFGHTSPREGQDPRQRVTADA